VVDEVEETRAIFGREIWDYSIEGSRPTLEALVAYLDEQKLSRRRMSVEELFVPNISPGLADYCAPPARTERRARAAEGRLDLQRALDPGDRLPAACVKLAAARRLRARTREQVGNLHRGLGAIMCA